MEENISDAGVKGDTWLEQYFCTREKGCGLVHKVGLK